MHDQLAALFNAGTVTAEDLNVTTLLQGETALIAASARNQVRVVELLLERGANVDQANNNGTTPLSPSTPMARQVTADQVRPTSTFT